MCCPLFVFGMIFVALLNKVCLETASRLHVIITNSPSSEDHELLKLQHT